VIRDWVGRDRFPNAQSSIAADPIARPALLG
jgi:hypothetical protein